MKKIIATIVSMVAVSIATAAPQEPGCAPGAPGVAAGGAPAVPEGNQEKAKPASAIQAAVVAKKRD